MEEDLRVYNDEKVSNSEEKEILDYSERITSLSIDIEQRIILDENFVPNANEMKIFVSDVFNNADHYSQNWKSLDLRNIGLDPDSVEIDNQDLDKSALEDVFDELEALQLDTNASDALYILVEYKVFEKMSQDDKNEVSLFMANNLKYFDEKLSYDMDLDREYALMLFKGFKPKGDVIPQIGEKVMEYVTALDEESKNIDFFDNVYTIDEFTRWGHQKILLEGIAHLEDKAKMDAYLGVLVDKHSLPRLLNTIRENMKIPESRESSEKLLLHLMGVADSEKSRGDVDIESFFLAINFEDKYPVEREVREETIDTVQEDLLRHGVPSGGSVLELGAAGGWLTGGLAERGFDAYGMELIPEYVARANENYGNRFIQASWYELDKAYQTERTQAETQGAPEKFHAVINRGRGSRHTEDSKNLSLLFANVDAVLEDEGIFEFDLADPLVGFQKEMLDDYRNYLHDRFNYDPDWLKKHFWHRVGAPLGQDGEKHYINTFDPPQDLVEEMAGAQGFKLLEVRREENYDGRGSDNLVYITQKLTGHEREVLISESKAKLADRNSQQFKHDNGRKTDVDYHPVNLKFYRDSENFVLVR